MDKSNVVRLSEHLSTKYPKDFKSFASVSPRIKQVVARNVKQLIPNVSNAKDVRRYASISQNMQFIVGNNHTTELDSSSTICKLTHKFYYLYWFTVASN